MVVEVVDCVVEVETEIEEVIALGSDSNVVPISRMLDDARKRIKVLFSVWL